MAKKKRGSHFKKKQPKTGVEAYFEQYTKKQVIALLLMSDAAVGIRNVILQELEEHLSEDQKARLAALPYSELVAPMSAEQIAALSGQQVVTPILEVESGAAFSSGEELPEE